VHTNALCSWLRKFLEVCSVLVNARSKGFLSLSLLNEAEIYATETCESFVTG
jgi:hypothetical protein